MGHKMKPLAANWLGDGHLQVQDLVEDNADGEGAEAAGSQGSLEVSLQ